jgi:hypothetical protein
MRPWSSHTPTNTHSKNRFLVSMVKLFTQNPNFDFFNFSFNSFFFGCGKWNIDHHSSKRSVKRVSKNLIYYFYLGLLFPDCLRYVILWISFLSNIVNFLRFVLRKESYPFSNFGFRNFVISFIFFFLDKKMKRKLNYVSIIFIYFYFFFWIYFSNSLIHIFCFFWREFTLGYEGDLPRILLFIFFVWRRHTPRQWCPFFGVMGNAYAPLKHCLSKRCKKKKKKKFLSV